MLTDAVRESMKSLHKNAAGMVCALTDIAKAARIYQQPAEMDPEVADTLAEVITGLMGINNTMVQAMADAESAADTTRYSLQVIRSASLRQLIAIRSRLRAAHKAATP